MGLASDFDVLWEQQKKQIDSAILLQEKKADGISCNELQKSYHALTGKWSDSLSAEYEFIKRLQREDLVRADTFQKKLADFAFTEMESPELPSVVPYVGGECVVCLAGAFLGYLLASRSFLGRILDVRLIMLLAAVLLGMMTVGIVRELYQNKKQEIWHRTGDAYRAQVDALGKALVSLLQGH